MCLLVNVTLGCSQVLLGYALHHNVRAVGQRFCLRLVLAAVPRAAEHRHVLSLDGCHLSVDQPTRSGANTATWSEAAAPRRADEEAQLERKAQLPDVVAAFAGSGFGLRWCIAAVRAHHVATLHVSTRVPYMVVTLRTRMDERDALARAPLRHTMVYTIQCQ